MDALPKDIEAWLGQVVVTEEHSATAELGAFSLFCAAVEDGNPLYRESAEAEALTGGPICPPALLSAWSRPDPWAPNGAPASRALELHFRLKEILGLPKAVVTRAETELHAPLRPGDRIISEQRLDAVSPVTENRLGRGRYWTISVLYRRASDRELLGAETLGFFGYGGEAA